MREREKQKNIKFHVICFGKYRLIGGRSSDTSEEEKNKPPKPIKHQVGETYFSHQCIVKALEKNLISKSFYENNKIKHSEEHSLYSEVSSQVLLVRNQCRHLSLLLGNNRSDWLFLDSLRSTSLLMYTFSQFSRLSFYQNKFKLGYFPSRITNI